VPFTANSHRSRKRLEIVRALFASGIHRSSVEDEVARLFHLKYREARNLVKFACDELAEVDKARRPAQRLAMELQLRDLYKKAVDAGDLSVAHRVSDTLCRIAGLMQPDKIEISGAVAMIPMPEMTLEGMQEHIEAGGRTLERAKALGLLGPAKSPNGGEVIELRAVEQEAVQVSPDPAAAVTDQKAEGGAA
jgi:hypothetical protein